MLCASDVKAIRSVHHLKLEAVNENDFFPANLERTLQLQLSQINQTMTNAQ
jgi:hypothetical protein